MSNPKKGEMKTLVCNNNQIIEKIILKNQKIKREVVSYLRLVQYLSIKYPNKKIKSSFNLIR